MRNFWLKISVVIISSLGLLNFAPAFVYADCANPASTKEAIECGTSNTSGVPVTNDPTTSINDTITTAINLLSAAVGIAAVIMLVVGAFRYVTSAGDSSKIASAKSTILYAIIGLVIVALAQVIVQFVLDNAVNPGTNHSAKNSSTGSGTGSGGSTATKGSGGSPP